MVEKYTCKGECPMNYNYHTIIIGGGAAGLMAAYTLASQKISVLVIEKAVSLQASNFMMCGGPAACETNLQRKENAWVSLEQIYNKLSVHGGYKINKTALYHCLKHTSDAIHILEEANIPMMLLPDSYKAGYRARHLIIAPPKERKEALMLLLQKAGVNFLFSHAVSEITSLSDDGFQIVTSSKKEDPRSFKCENIIICTGGFLSNKEMLKEYLGVDQVISLGSHHCTGDGIRLAKSVGAMVDQNFCVLGNEGGGTTSKMSGFPYNSEWMLKNSNLEFWVYGGLIVNSCGERIVNEKEIADAPLSIGGDLLIREKKCYCIMDDTYYQACHSQGIFSFLNNPTDWPAGVLSQMHNYPAESIEEHLESSIKQGWGYKADSIKELADYFHLDLLEDTISEYNKCCESKTDPIFSKPLQFLTPILKAPFYAFEYEPAAWGTQGGIKTDSKLRALDQEGHPITGLYIAGVDNGSIFTNPYYPGEGCSVGISMGSGVYAANCILKNK